MDVVITYVDGNDPVWKQDYQKYTDVPVMEKRFRDWGTLKYLLRGVQENMPFVRNVFLVVSHPSQVPQWADTENLKVVLHSDIIPSEYLPTFNSTTIEMFLHRIEGLDEEFVYFNDDIFPIAPSSEEDLFIDGKAVIGIARHIFSSSMYKTHVKRSDMMAREALGMSRSLCFVRAQHSCIPVLKSQCAEVSDLQKKKVLNTLSRVRDYGNINMTFFLAYMFHKGLVVNKRISCGHISLAAVTSSKLLDSIMKPKRKFLCINDVKLSEERYETYRKIMAECFEKRFPNKSRFEIQ
jgi:hypothetical protein